MKKKRVLLFDAMGVIYTVGDDTNELLVPFVTQKNPDMSPRRIVDLYMQASLGAITSQSLWQQVGLSAAYPYIEMEYLFTKIHINRELYTIIPRLLQSNNLAILSNDVSEWSAMLRRKYLLDEFFGNAFISGDLKVRKPNIEIYELALQRLQCDPGDCVFIDDNVRNLLPAKELGMRVILFSKEGGNADHGIERVASLLELPGLVERL